MPGRCEVCSRGSPSSSFIWHWTAKRCAPRRASGIPGAPPGASGTLIFSPARNSTDFCRSKTSNSLPGVNWPARRPNPSEAHAYEFSTYTRFIENQDPLEKPSSLLFDRAGDRPARGGVDFLFALGGKPPHRAEGAARKGAETVGE